MDQNKIETFSYELQSLIAKKKLSIHEVLQALTIIDMRAREKKDDKKTTMGNEEELDHL